MWRVVPPNQGLDLNPSERNLLWLAIEIGALLRVLYHFDRAFIGDECGTFLYVQRSISFLLTHFETWLTMNYFIVLEKGVATVLGSSLTALGLVPMLAGLATIPLTALLATRLLSPRVGVLAAFLVALNPYLIKMSGVARSYSLLVALSLLSVHLYFRWASNRSRSNAVAFAISCFFLLLSHPNGLYTVAFLGFMIGVDLYRNPQGTYRREVLATLLLPLLIAAGCTCLAYSQILPPMLTMGKVWHEQRPTGFGFLPTTFSQYFGKSPYGGVTLLFLALGSIGIYCRHHRIGLVFTSWILIPVFLMSLQCLSHWYTAYARLLIASLPVLLMVVATGIDRIAAFNRVERSRNRLRIALVVILTISWAPNGFRILREKQYYSRYKAAAKLITTTAQTGDIVVSPFLVNLHLLPYLPTDRFTNIALEKFMKTEGWSKRAKRVVMVTSKPVQSLFPNKAVPHLRIIFYPLENRDRALRLFLQDLRKTKDTNSNPRSLLLADQQICAIESHLGDPHHGADCNLSRKLQQKRRLFKKEKNHTLF